VSKRKKRSGQDDAPQAPDDTESPSEEELQPERRIEPPKRVPIDQAQIDPSKPSLAGLDEWIRNKTVIAMGLVIATAFVAKSIAPFHSFTVGLVLGVAAVVGLYLIGFYRGRGKL
jgi:hypothetical protein